MKNLIGQLQRIQKDIELLFNFASLALFAGTLGNVLYDFQITYLIISVFVAIGLFVATKIIIQRQLVNTSYKIYFYEKKLHNIVNY